MGAVRTGFVGDCDWSTWFAFGGVMLAAKRKHFEFKLLFIGVAVDPIGMVKVTDEHAGV